MLLAFVLNTVHAQKHNFKNELLDVEKAFATMAKEKGFKAANEAYAADNALVFRPKAINAKAWGAKQSDSIFGLSWTALFADMASNGDLGYATGPFENRYDPADTSKVVYGQFVTVWKRQPEGQLKFIMDFGSANLPEGFVFPDEKGSTASQKSQNTKLIAASTAEMQVQKMEQQFQQIGMNQNEAKAFQSFSSNTTRFIYQRQIYLIGRSNVIKHLEKTQGFSRWKTEAMTTASSGDMVHLWGTFTNENAAGKKGYFMRIWKRTGSKWEIVLSVQNFVDAL